MRFSQNLAAATVLSLGASFAHAQQPCNTSFVDARSVAAQLKSVPVAEWDKPTIAKLDEPTRHAVRKYLTSGSTRLSRNDERIFDKLESGRAFDPITLLSQASPAASNAIVSVLDHKADINTARMQATMETIKTNTQILATFDSIKQDGCLSFVNQKPSAPTPKR